MNTCYRQYRPITAAPLRNNGSYRELAPCDALKPYVKCFWTSTSNAVNGEPSGELIIPDTCMDIIFEVNHTRNSLVSRFVAINSQSFTTADTKEKGESSSVFGIRFFAWTASLFSQDSMSGVKNNVYDAQQHYGAITAALEPLLFEITSMHARVKVAEKILLLRLEAGRQKPALEAAMDIILAKKGNIRTALLADELFLCSRQLERLFNEYTGVSPKQLSSLIRYQYLWQDILSDRSFNIADAVYKYGYTDQSHLLRDFKKYHTLLPNDARDYARLKAGIPVANLQY